MVVDDDGEVIRGEAVGLEQDLVVDVRVVEAHVTAHQVVPFGDAVGHAQADHRGHSVRAFHGDLGLPGQTAPVVPRRLRAGSLLLAHRGEPGRCARAPVRVAFGDELVRVLAVDGDAQRLDVRIVRTADLWAFVPVEPEPAERLDDQRLGAGDVSLLIGVLDSEDEVATGVARGEPRKEGGADRAEMQRTGG